MAQFLQKAKLEYSSEIKALDGAADCIWTSSEC